jgi:hypothetical protein
MNALGTGLILMANGLLTMLHHLADKVTLVSVLSVLSLWWLATIEIEELNRQGTKPDVGRH